MILIWYFIWYDLWVKAGKGASLSQCPALMFGQFPILLVEIFNTIYTTVEIWIRK